MLLFVVAAIFCLDRLIKYLALHYTTDGVFLFSPHFIRFELHKNFGIIANFPLPKFLIIAVSLLIIAFLIFSLLKTPNKKTKIALALIIAGALSNLVDRIIYGYVIDYALILDTSYINLSDLLILAGIIVFVL